MSGQANKRLTAAIAIHNQLSNRVDKPGLPALPTDTWHECLRIERLMKKAKTLGYELTENRLRRRLSSTVRTLRLQLDSFGCDSVASEALIPSVHDIFADLNALNDEFTDVSASVKQHVVSVHTGSIELDGVELGPFRIELDWRRLDCGNAFEVIAIEPYRAASCDMTTHPHVQNDTLCCGDGTNAIAAALSDGRLFDLFILVRQVLRTYNPDSAYVRLEDWAGVECPDCAQVVDDDESTCCESCSTTTCWECATTCGDCDNRFCSDCIQSCLVCEDSTCASCLTECSDCGDAYCESCLTDERCTECDEAKETDKEPPTSKTTPPTKEATDDSVHPVLLEQTAVSA